ncbi:sugar phosphate isomerase/epimerase family protein [Spirosoma areae]
MKNVSRRTFVQTCLLTAALPVVVTTQSPPLPVGADPLKIRFFCPRWGATDSWDAFCKRVKEAGYDGVEVAFQSADELERRTMLAALQAHKLDVIAQSLSSFADIGQHTAHFERTLRDLAATRPLFINSQTGKDFFSFGQNKRLLALADTVARETGVKILHETHRGKFSYAASVTQAFLEKMPNLRLTFDVSHWCNVSESLLDDQAAAIELALSRTDHIHARIGHAEGPQVNDPRAPEWNKAVQAHLHWWDAIVAWHRQQGTAVLTITPEFGPPPYLPTQPYSQQPLADQWTLNLYMKDLIQQRYRA